MGNCCRRESRSMVWAGDDWGSLTSKNEQAENTCKMERQRLLGENGPFGASSPCTSPTPTATREVKIRITKKELEKLVGRRVDVQGLSAKQVLARLIDVDAHRYDDEDEHHRPWRPALQSIPEVN